VFSVRPDESSAARGKMALSEAVTQGHLSESGIYRNYLEKCLLCGACEEACPNEVKTLNTMLGARERLAGNAGIKPGKRLILEHVVGGPRLLDLAMRAGRTFQSLMFKKIPAESGIRRRIPLPLITQDRTLPGLARTFFTDRFSGRVVEGNGPRVGIFAGCMTNYFYPETGETMLELLRRIGASVYVPEKQVCCGMPALTGGAREITRDLSRQNLEAFEEYELDAIVTGCASCGGNLKENYGDLLREAGVEDRRIEQFISKIFDINEFLYRYKKPEQGSIMGERDKESATELTVTYHHPCHLGRLQNIKDEPIALIKSIAGVRYIPMVDDLRCCGMGGSFSLEYYDIAKEVNDQKVARIIETGADAVVTSCPACIMHIRDGLHRNQREDIEVLHITELLERYDSEKQDPVPSTQPFDKAQGPEPVEGEPEEEQEQ
jgi:glycolate oxidase iron-sulfur subunit